MENSCQLKHETEIITETNFFISQEGEKNERKRFFGAMKSQRNLCNIARSTRRDYRRRFKLRYYNC